MALQTYTPDDSRIVHETGVDFNNRARLFKPVHVVQYDDKLPVLAVSLYNNGEEYALPAGFDANIRVGKKGRKFVEKAALGCSQDRKILYFEISVQMVTDWGKLYPIVSIINGDTLAGSSPILLIVDRNPIQEGDVESSDEFIDLSKSVEAAKNYAEQAKSSAEGMDQYATRAEDAADRAEGAVGQLTNEVERAETAAQKAEDAASGLDEKIEAAQKEMTQTIDDAKQTMETAKQDVTDAATEAKQSIEQTKTEAEQAIESKISESMADFEQVKEETLSEVDAKNQETLTSVDSKNQAALQEFNQVKDDTLGKLTEMEQTIQADVDTTAKNAETAKQYSGNPPKVNEIGNWEIWDAESQEYQDSGKRAILNFDVTYTSKDEMDLNAGNQPTNTVAIISSDVEKEENAQVYIKNVDGTWHFLADLSGFKGVGIETWEKTAGTGAPGSKDSYKVTYTDGRDFTYDVYNGKDGEGSGDMTAAVYDKSNKQTDIFDYVDNAVSGIVTTINEETPTTLTGLLKGDGEHLQTAEAGVDYIEPSALDDKQDKLTGSSGQLVGFDGAGNAIAQDAPDAGDMKQSVYDTKGQSRDIFDYVDTAVAEKQDKLTGTNGQVVGFDEAGNPEAQPIPTGPAGPAGPAGVNGKDGTPAGFGEATATVDDGVGVPSVTVTTDGPDTQKQFHFEFKNLKGEPGENGTPGKDGAVGANGQDAGFGEVTATVGTGVGTPSVTVTTEGPSTAKQFHFEFQNLKGEPGKDGSPGATGLQGPAGANGEDGKDGAPGAAAGFGSPTAEIGTGTGDTPTVSVTADGPDTKKVFHFSFDNLKGATGPAGPAGAAGSPGKDGAAGSTGPQGPAGPNAISGTTTTAFNGLLKGNGSTVAQAVAGTDYAKAPFARTITIPTSGWSGNSQAIACQGVSSNETTQVVYVCPKASDFKAYSDAGLYVSAVADNSLTFAYTKAPSAALTVYVAIQNL